MEVNTRTRRVLHSPSRWALFAIVDGGEEKPSDEQIAHEERHLICCEILAGFVLHIAGLHPLLVGCLRISYSGLVARERQRAPISEVQRLVEKDGVHTRRVAEQHAEAIWHELQSEAALMQVEPNFRDVLEVAVLKLDRLAAGELSVIVDAEEVSNTTE